MESNFSSDPSYHQDSISIQPVHILEEVVKRIVDKHKRDANLAALPTAQLTAIVISFMGSKEEVSPNDFLPYPPPPPIAEETVAIFRQLMREKLIPIHIIPIAGKFSNLLFEKE